MSKQIALSRSRSSSAGSAFLNARVRARPLVELNKDYTYWLGYQAPVNHNTLSVVVK